MSPQSRSKVHENAFSQHHKPRTPGLHYLRRGSTNSQIGDDHLRVPAMVSQGSAKIEARFPSDQNHVEKYRALESPLVIVGYDVGCRRARERRRRR